MPKLSKEFFFDNEILFWDHSKKGALCPLSKRVSKTFSTLGIKVLTLKTSGNAGDADLRSLERVPRSAYVLYDRKDEQNVISQLIQNGVKCILFHPLMAPSKTAINNCKGNGVDTIIGCPRMVLGKGFCKLHALFS
ncbi:MAG TPA: hypothetical protein VHT96_13995 [Clostridia bacterium]|nr:hypothetical protein [Clostridia bacterium]